MEFLGDSEELAASDVLLFVREAVHRYDLHKGLILDKLLEVFSTIRAAKYVDFSLTLRMYFFCSGLALNMQDLYILCASEV